MRISENRARSKKEAAIAEKYAHPGVLVDTQWNEMHVPAGKPVVLPITSRDVIHSFYMPHLRVKQEAVPGRVIKAWFEAAKPGKSETPCAELFGFGHSGMKG